MQLKTQFLLLLMMVSGLTGTVGAAEKGIRYYAKSVVGVKAVATEDPCAAVFIHPNLALSGSMCINGNYFPPELYHLEFELLAKYTPVLHFGLDLLERVHQSFVQSWNLKHFVTFIDDEGIQREGKVIYTAGARTWGPHHNHLVAIYFRDYYHPIIAELDRSQEPLSPKSLLYQSAIGSSLSPPIFPNQYSPILKLASIEPRSRAASTLVPSGNLELMILFKSASAPTGAGEYTGISNYFFANSIIFNPQGKLVALSDGIYLITYSLLQFYPEEQESLFGYRYPLIDLRSSAVADILTKLREKLVDTM